MNEQLKILVAAILDKAMSESNINSQLKQLKIDNLKLNVDINSSTTTIKTEVQKAAQKVNQYIKSSVVTPINIPFQFDTSNSSKMKTEMEKIVKSISENKGNLVDYKINTRMVLDDDKENRVEKLTGVTLQYKNALNELITTEIKYQQISTQTNPDGSTEAIMGWSTATQHYQQNIEKTIALQQKQLEADAKVARGKIELAKQMDNMNAKANKAGIQLSPENQAQFNSKLNSAKTIKDLQEVGHYIKMADLEWKGLNATMTKDMPNTALENVNKKLLTMSPALDTLQSKFQTLGSSTPKDTSSKFDGLRQALAAINAQDDPGKKINQYNELIASVQKLSAELRSAKQKQTATKFDTNLGLDKIKLDNRLTSWLKENQKAAKLCGAEIESIRSLIQGADKMQLGQLQKEFQNLQTRAKALGVTGRTAFGELGHNAKKFFDWFMVGGAVSSAVRAVKEIYTNVVELDTAMVELRKVTEATDSQFISFLERAKTKSVALGSSLVDLVNATSNFSRLGYSLGEAETLGQTATVYANVGDDVKNVDEATSSLISTMKAFDIQASNSISIIDKLNEVGNKTSISSGDLGSALTRSASAMAEANNTLDETIALIVAGNEVVQDADVVGTGLKTVSLRVRGATADLKEMGEEIDELASSTPKLQSELKSLTGVDIMIDENTFKSTYQILQEISKVWDTLTDVSQASVLETLFGKRQANIGASIISNFDSAEKALATSLDSAGSAMKEHSIWLDSVEAKQKQFTAQFQAFSTTVLDSGLITGSFDAGTGILKFFTDLISMMGAVPALAATVAGALSFKNIGISQEYALLLPIGAVA